MNKKIRIKSVLKHRVALFEGAITSEFVGALLTTCTCVYKQGKYF